MDTVIAGIGDENNRVIKRVHAVKGDVTAVG